MTYELVEFIEMEQCPLDPEIVFNISVKMTEFHRNISVDLHYLDEAKEKLLDARLTLNSARLLLVQAIESEDNDYIRQNKKSWDFMVDNFSRFDKRMDTTEADTFHILEREQGISPKAKPKYEVDIDVYMNPTAISRLLPYKRELSEAAEHLVFFPLKNAYRRWLVCPDKDKYNLPIKKDKMLFSYFLFVNLFHASQTLGSLAREQNPKISKGYTTTSLPNTGTGMEMVAPPGMPQNVRIEEKEEALEEAIEDYFSIPSELSEEET